MQVSLDSFTQAASSTILGSRSIVVAKDSVNVKLGNLFISPSKTVNDDTMKAFKEALRKEFGVFGEHAFDTVVGTRQQMSKSLRATDIKTTLSVLDFVRTNRFVGELQRQCETSPLMHELPVPLQQEVRQMLKGTAKNFLPMLREMKNQDELDKFVADKLNTAIQTVKKRSPIVFSEVAGNGGIEKPVKPHDTTGLKFMDNGTIVDSIATSVEDRVKNCTLGTGMRINSHATQPMLLEKLKTNGVEPGFIYRNDWSVDDTRGYMADVYSQECKAEMDRLIAKRPDLQLMRTMGVSYREIGLHVGRQHSAGIAFAAEFILQRDLDNPNSPIAKAFAEKFPDKTKADLFQPSNELFDEAEPIEPTEEQRKNREIVKKALFAQIRDAVMNVSEKDGDRDISPIFKQFRQRNIAKLDYNEKDKRSIWGGGSFGFFRLPERCSVKGGDIKGFFFRNFRLTSAKDASTGAVAESFANDLTRLLGVPAQELSIIRGQYSDGTPKLMLTAKFADGYKDFEKEFLKDGQVVSPDGKKIESLGKYKAIFLALADRDAVGSHGQNKGIRDGRFFAIDPGHSLEGNGSDLTIHDNLSFKDDGFILKRLFEKRFRNFSVFDDDTRFAKLEGVLKLRELRDSGKITELANRYKDSFNPDAPRLSSQEKSLRKEIGKKIDSMVKEFNKQIDTIINVCDAQLKLYDALKPDGPEVQKNAIEMIENLEKLTSPTTWTSPNGKVELKHLSVIGKTRIPWSATADTLNITYKSSKPLDMTNRTRLQHFAQLAGVKCTFDDKGYATIEVPRETPEAAFNTFTEDNIAAGLYPQEAQRRRAAVAADV